MHHSHLHIQHAIRGFKLTNHRKLIAYSFTDTLLWVNFVEDKVQMCAIVYCVTIVFTLPWQTDSLWVPHGFSSVDKIKENMSSTLKWTNKLLP